MRIVFLAVLLVLLAACASTPKPRMFPPNASVQELKVLPDGSWEVALRVQNVARLGIRVSTVEATLRVGDVEATRIKQTLDLSIPASSAERIALTIAPSAGAADAVSLALSEGRSLSYAIEGSIATVEPSRRNDRFSFSSQLSPAPGLPGTLR